MLTLAAREAQIIGWRRLAQVDVPCVMLEPIRRGTEEEDQVIRQGRRRPPVNLELNTYLIGGLMVYW